MLLGKSVNMALFFVAVCPRFLRPRKAVRCVGRASHAPHTTAHGDRNGFFFVGANAKNLGGDFRRTTLTFDHFYVKKLVWSKTIYAWSVSNERIRMGA